MNGGIIANRYAKAFFKWTDSRSTADDVYAQARLILSALGKVPAMTKMIGKAIPSKEKLRIISLTLGESVQMHPDILALWNLMDSNGRTAYFRMALLDYLQEYRNARGLLMVQLTTAAPNSDLVSMIEEKVRQDFGMTPVVVQRQNPDLIGGFVCESWGYKLDSSVRRALQQVGKNLTVNEKKLV